jgi:hypothetical protein
MSKHILTILKGFFFVLGAAIICAVAEKACVKLGVPDYINVGIFRISVVLFILDAMVLVGVAIALALETIAITFIRVIKKVQKEWQKPPKR